MVLEKQKMKQKFNTEIAKKILTTMAMWTVSGVTGLALGALFAAVPGLGFVVKGIADMIGGASSKERYKYKATFKDLMKARLIEKRKLPDGKLALVLSEDGRKKVLSYDFDDLKISAPKKWDRKWRIIIFDLPKRFERERQAWRLKLRRLGFYQLQKSVWIHPFECENEIDFVTEHFGISPHVRIIVTEKFSGSEEVKDFFNLV